MADAVLVLLIVGASAGDVPPSPATVQEAMREAIGQEVRVLVEQRATPSDAEVRTAASTLHASAIADVHWIDPEHLHAHVRIFIAPDGAFYERDLEFKPADAVPERERAMGFTAGAMIRVSTVMMPAPAPPTEPPKEPPPAPATGPVDVVPPPPQPVPGPPIERPAPRFVVAVHGLGIAGVDAGMWTAGPALSIGYQVYPSLELRVRGAIAFGSVPAPDASVLEGRAGGGAFWTIARSGGLRFGVQGDALAVFDSVSRSSPRATRERWLPALGVGVGVGYALTRSVEPFVEAGVETTFTTTHITVGGASAGELPGYRGLAATGLRARF
jgi:hypothetical protein